jgi:FtsP/CotA-like multicopper oxidase with cupredoxin domain
VSARVAAADAPDAEEPRPIWERSEAFFWEETSPKMNEQSNAHNTVWKLTDPDANAGAGATNEDIQWKFTRGEPAKIEIQGGPMQHPIHFHGQRFLVLSVNGVKNPNLQWKDTVLVPAGQKVEILLDNSNTGKWMFHCHIGRHAIDAPEHRMTGYFDVVEPGEDPGGGGQTH